MRYAKMAVPSRATMRLSRQGIDSWAQAREPLLQTVYSVGAATALLVALANTPVGVAWLGVCLTALLSLVVGYAASMANFFFFEFARPINEALGRSALVGPVFLVLWPLVALLLTAVSVSNGVWDLRFAIVMCFWSGIGLAAVKIRREERRGALRT